ncbi:MAG: ATP-binding protein [Endomicrobium sp.]|jgi:predicted AAA+ superfamily ATPase|nr:ATP-binding protein [Endomicrobium sp.]
MHKKRTLKNTLLEYSNSFKVILITGARQVGKTTFLKNSAQSNRKYVSLDDPSELLKAKTDPKGFLITYEPPVFIDEVQYAPEIFKYIKMLVDDSDNRGQIWLTGSQVFNMMQGITESLAGRVAIVNMFGFSIYERFGKGDLQKPFLPAKKNITSVLKYKSPSETFRIICQGSFPDVIEKNPKERTAFYDSYVKTYLERDVRQIINISDEISFIKFLKAIAARTGQELNLTDIAKDVDISTNTAKSWISVLQISGLIFLLQPYFRNVVKRLIKTPKLYFMDTGLAAYLAGWTTPESLEAGISSGAFFETFAISEIIKSYNHNGLTPNLYYYRDNNKNEIDLLINQDGQFYPIEIKKTATPKEDDIKAFKAFSKMEKVAFGNLICLADKSKPLNENATAISIWDI